MNTSTSSQRFFKRALILAIVGVVSAYFQNGYERDGQIWMFFAEMAIYVVALFVYLSGQTGRLKSRPDSNAVSSEVLFEEDPSVRTYIALYLFVLMLVVVTYAFLGNEIDLGPWNIFASICPIFLIVFVRQHRLERRREMS